MPLDSRVLKRLAPPPTVRRLFDGGGLHLVVTPRGCATWRLTYRFGGRQQSLRLGRYPEMSLAQARRKRVGVQRLLRKQVDPRHAETRRERERRLASGATFAEVAAEWLEQQAGLAPRTVTDQRSSLRRHLNPSLGDRPINEIEPLDVLDVLRPFERRGEVRLARRLLRLSGRIFRYGVITSRCLRDPTVDLSEALRPRPPHKGHPALSASALPDFYARLARSGARSCTRQAFHLLLLTFVRPYELRLAVWDEFEGLEGDQPIWRIPGPRMKRRRPHVVPLSPQAVAVLAEARALPRKSRYVFPGPRQSGAISTGTLGVALRRMGYGGVASAHGFRKLAATVLNEEQFNSDWIEAQLSHRENSIRNVYNAADWLPGRRQMMCWWGEYLAKAAAQSGFPLPGGAADSPPVSAHAPLEGAPGRQGGRARRA